MSEKKDIVKSDGSEVASTTDVIFMPAVDIYEQSELIKLTANMPGVNTDKVNVSIENGVLTVEGCACIETPADSRKIGSECSYGRYRRDFTLSDAIDTEKISARMNCGVLEVTLPKREQLKPRQIKIES
jgi:HSP20 family molecular chaperone IbpA